MSYSLYLWHWSEQANAGGYHWSPKLEDQPAALCLMELAAK